MKCIKLKGRWHGEVYTNCIPGHTVGVRRIEWIGKWKLSQWQSCSWAIECCIKCHWLCFNYAMHAVTQLYANCSLYFEFTCH